MKISIKYLFIILPLLLTACRNTEKNNSETHEEEHEHAEGQKEVEVSAAQYKALKIQLGKIEQKNLTSTLHSTGFLKVPPQNKATITSQIGGTVKSILVQEGDVVKSGQVLATVSNPEFINMQQEYLDASAQLEFMKNDYERQKELAGKNVTAQKVYQQVEANYKSLKSKSQSLKQQLSSLGISTDNLTIENISNVISIPAPINGNVSHITINIGSTLQPTDELMNVVDNSQLHLDLFIYEQDLSKVKKDQMVDITLTNLPGKHYSAKVFAIGTAFEGNSKSIPVHASIVGDKTGLIEGMNVTANINIGDNLTASVPTSAVVSAGGDSYIFLQSEGHPHYEHEHKDSESKAEKEEPGDIYTFEKVQVKTGVSNAGFIEIVSLEPLPENAKVVIEGAYYLMAMLTNEGEHEH